MDLLVPASPISRRRFLRQSFAFSAAVALAPLSRAVPSNSHAVGAVEILMIGDWGYEDATGQAMVAKALSEYAQRHALHTEAFLLLGDNWYGALEGGVHSPRWQTNFEDMYPASVFNCPAYAILGNHDYQMYPESKVEAELAYARSGRTRWTMPARWYRFEFPASRPLITFLALDSNVPHNNGIIFRGRDFTLTEQQHAEQLAWLETELKRPRTSPSSSRWATTPSTPTDRTATTPGSFAIGTRSSASTKFPSTSRDTTTTCSTLSSKATPQASSFPAVAEPTSTTSKSTPQSADPMLRRSTASATFRLRLN
jgi:hypothetical protein